MVMYSNKMVVYIFYMMKNELLYIVYNN